MSWRSTAMILGGFMVAGVPIWFAPALLVLLGLSEFAFVGQLCLAILGLSALEAAFRRLAGSSADHEIGQTERPPDP